MPTFFATLPATSRNGGTTDVMPACGPYTSDQTACPIDEGLSRRLICGIQPNNPPGLAHRQAEALHGILLPDHIGPLAGVACVPPQCRDRLLL